MPFFIKNSQRVLVASPFNYTYWSQRYIEREDRLEEIFTISPFLKLPYEALSSFYEVENSSASDRHQVLHHSNPSNIFIISSLLLLNSSTFLIMPSPAPNLFFTSTFLSFSSVVIKKEGFILSRTCSIKNAPSSFGNLLLYSHYHYLP